MSGGGRNRLLTFEMLLSATQLLSFVREFPERRCTTSLLVCEFWDIPALCDIAMLCCRKRDPLWLPSSSHRTYCGRCLIEGRRYIRDHPSTRLRELLWVEILEEVLDRLYTELETAADTADCNGQSVTYFCELSSRSFATKESSKGMIQTDFLCPANLTYMTYLGYNGRRGGGEGRGKSCRLRRCSL